MNLHPHFGFAQSPQRVRWLLGILWAAIAVKCVAVWWAIGHWHMPFHPLWIVGPTVVFAGLATTLWVANREA